MAVLHERKRCMPGPGVSCSPEPSMWPSMAFQPPAFSSATFGACRGRRLAALAVCLSFRRRCQMSGSLGWLLLVLTVLHWHHYGASNGFWRSFQNQWASMIRVRFAPLKRALRSWLDAWAFKWEVGVRLVFSLMSKFGREFLHRQSWIARIAIAMYQDV